MSSHFGVSSDIVGDAIGKGIIDKRNCYGQIFDLTDIPWQMVNTVSPGDFEDMLILLIPLEHLWNFNRGGANLRWSPMTNQTWLFTVELYVCMFPYTKDLKVDRTVRAGHAEEEEEKEERSMDRAIQNLYVTPKNRPTKLNAAAVAKKKFQVEVRDLYPGWTCSSGSEGHV